MLSLNPNLLIKCNNYVIRIWKTLKPKYINLVYPVAISLQTIINEYDEDGSGRIEFPEFLAMMARKAREERDKEHLHWQEVFRVFTMPSVLPGTTSMKNKEGQNVTVFPKTLEQAGFDKEPKIIDRELPIEEFR